MIKQINRLKRVRILVFFTFMAVASLFLLSFSVSHKFADDFWQQLGMNKEKGNEGIKESFLRGYLYYYNARNAKNIAAGNRVAVAKDLLTYAKQYINSDAFKNAYESERKNATPVEPDGKAVRSKEQVRKDEIAKLEKSIRELEESMKKMTTEIQKDLQPVLDMQRKSVKEYQEPDNEMIELFYQGEKMTYESKVKSYQEQLKRWEEEYPVDYTQVIKKRLQKFLDITKDIDFNATLKDQYGKKRFANPVYESKPTEWKQAFRAGKDVTEMARAFAKQWLGELK